MPDVVRHILASPRTWLSVGTLCLGLSFLLSYHLEQRSADLVLSQKVGQPRAVLVQNFIPELHKNMLNGVHVLGQTSRDEHLTVNIGTASDPRWITVRPIYAVGPEFMPMARQHLRQARGDRVRPVPREASDVLRRERREIAGISDMALAFLITEAPDASDHDQAASAFNRIGSDDAGSLVEIVGLEIMGSSLRETVSDALLSSGTRSVPDSLLIASPTLAIQAPANDSAVAAMRWWLAAAGVLMAVGALAGPRLRDFVVRRSPRPTPVQSVEAQGSFPAVEAFQPIASQDELAIDEQRAMSQSSPGSQIRRRMSRLTDFAASSFGGVRSPR